jgi:cyclophilin family peptidyl-prolyl cis-trans isomerase
MLSMSVAWLLAAQVSGSTSAPTAASQPLPKGPVVVMQTSKGRIVIGLDRAKAPLSVANFITYVRGGFYDGTIFHRVSANPRVIQGGGFDEQLKEQATRPPVRNESTNGLSNRRGTIAMARTPNPHSATAQFYINVADNTFLDGSPGRPGYAVFGEVLEGMDVVDRIAAAPTHGKKGMADVPIEAVIIKRVREAPGWRPASASNTTPTSAAKPARATTPRAR